MWQRLNSRQLLNHPHLSIYEDELLLPDGTQLAWLRYGSDHDAAMVIGQREDGQILVQREFSYPQQQILIDFPGGGIELGETPEAGANRELAEEAGFRAGRLTLLGTYLSNRRRSNAKMYVFLGSELTPEKATPDTGEQIEVLWQSEAAIENLIRQGEVLSPRFLAAWSLYRLRTP